VDAFERAEQVDLADQLARISYLHSQYPHQLFCQECSYNAFIELSQLGSTYLLDHALSLARCVALPSMVLTTRGMAYVTSEIVCTSGHACTSL
jgi:hypothetical protein